MSHHKIDSERRELARQARRWSVEAFHDLLAEAGVERAFVVCENGEISLSHPRLLAPVKALFELSKDFADHEGVFIGREEGIPTLFVASVHDTRRGLAQGGLRFKPYESLADLLIDGLRLARGMTRKNALAGLWWGGGKGTIPRTRGLEGAAYRTEESPERLALFRAYGRFIASLGGVYYTAEDVGTKTSDMNAMLAANRFTTCVGGELGGSGNPSPFTARGVFRGMQAGWRFLHGSDDLAGVKVAVQGVGNVGAPLVDLLDAAGARIWVTDVDREALAAAKRRHPRITVVELDEIFDLDADVFAPCAIGAQVNAQTIPRLKVSLVCGAANNILGEEADAERLRERGIVFVPDYLCNRMGITNCADEWQGYLEEDVELAAERVYPDTLRVLKHARSLQTTSSAAADLLADAAASELHPLIGHRGRRLIDHLMATGWHRPQGRRQGGPKGSATAFVPAFVPGLDEPAIRVRWDAERRFRGGAGCLAAAPIAAVGRPDLSSFLSALLMDVRARALALVDGREPRRAVGSDPGGLALQLAVERTLPWEREEIGRSQLLERCLDFHRRSDAAIREQLRGLGVGFDPQRWLDTLSEEGRSGVRRLYHALEDSGLLARERRLSFFDPVSQTVLVSGDVTSTRVEVGECFVVRFEAETEGGEGRQVETQTFQPELLAGAVALSVRREGPHGELAGGVARHPLSGAELPVLAVGEQATEAKFLVPAHHRDDRETALAHGIVEHPEAIDLQGRVLLPGEPPLPLEVGRRRVLERLGEHVTRLEGRFTVDAFRSRGSEHLVGLGTSEQLFVRLDRGAGHLRRAIESGAVAFDDERWRRRALQLVDEVEPWCVSRQHWWGHPLPGREGEEVLSSFFALVAWSLAAAGWPREAAPEPIDEVFVDPDLLARWVIPSQIVSLHLTGRPAFRRVHVHGALHVVERLLEERTGASSHENDEERFVARFVRRPLRRLAGHGIEPAALVRRFGADALRLGYLLCLSSGSQESATLTESALRRARRTVHRLAAKVAGLYHLAEGVEEGPARLADDWIGVRAARAREQAEAAYREHRLADAGQLLAAAVDDLARYTALAAARLKAAAGETKTEVRGESGAPRAALALALAELDRGFSPICPFLFEKLTAWSRQRSEAGGEPPAAWVGELVDHLSQRRGESAELGSHDPEAHSRLEAGWEELERLSGCDLTVTDNLGRGEAVVVGPCVVVWPGEGRMPAGASAAAMWYRQLHL